MGTNLKPSGIDHYDVTRNLGPQEKLTYGIRTNQPNLVKEALDLGARVDRTMGGSLLIKPFITKSGDGLPILNAAVLTGIQNDNPAILEVMEQQGIDFDDTLHEVANAEMLMRTTTGGSFLSFLLTHWPKKNAPIKDVFTLHQMAERGHPAKIKGMLALGYLVDDRDNIGRTALMCASSGAGATHLIQSGADLKAVDNQGKTATWHAAQRLIKRMKHVNGEFRVDATYTFALTAILREHPLIEDKHAISISKQLRRRLNNGLKVNFAMATDDISFKRIIENIEVVESYDRNRKLGRIIKGSAARDRQQNGVKITKNKF